MTMYDFLLELGFKKFDIALLIMCPIGAILGSYAHAILLTINPAKMPAPGGMRPVSPLDALGRFSWTMNRFMLGAILGLVVALYFIGAVHENTTTLAKLGALSILIGFAAPKLWVAQERIVVEQATKRLSEMMGKAGRTPNTGENKAVEAAQAEPVDRS
jgi:hypothetical protein